MEVQPITPAPASVAALVQQLADGWPEQGADADTLLSGLGFTVVSRDDSRPDSGEFTRLDTPVAQTTALLLRRPGGGAGLSLFAGFSTGQVAQARRGYQAVLGLLSECYGPPSQQWGPEGEPACCWRREGRLVEMYAHTRTSPIVQIAVSAL